MSLWRKIVCYLKWPLILLLQVAMIILILAVLPIFPRLIPYLEDHPLAMLAMVGAVFAFGSFQIGWLGVHFGWLSKDHTIWTRLIAVLLGSYLPLDLGLLFYPGMESGNPFYIVALVTSVIAFHLPEWIKVIRQRRRR
jgi:hypothetical protein